MSCIYRVIGAIVIVAGLYFVVWGKSKDYESRSPSTDGQMIQEKQTTGTGSDSNGNSNPEGIIQDEQIHRQRDQLIV